MIDTIPAIVGLPLAAALAILWLWLVFRPVRRPVSLEAPADAIVREVRELLGESDRG